MTKLEILRRLKAATRRTLAAFDFDAGTLRRSYGKGKWSAREILAHLTDCELVFATRLKFLLAEDRPVVVPFDQDLWAARGRYAKADLRLLRRTFGVLREQFARGVAAMSAADFHRRGRHPEKQDYDVRYLVEHGIEHNERHLEQLAAIKARRSWPA